MNREIPHDEDAICDECGAKGAYDFMGDYFCVECVRNLLAEFVEEEEEDR